MACVVILLTGLAHAEQAPPAPSAPAKDEFNFELGAPGEHKPSLVQDPAEKLRLQKLEERVKLRRKMLLTHQALGFITLGALLATNIIGTLHFEDKFNGDHTDIYKNAHLGLGIASSAVFAATAATALFAPNPYPKPIKFDTAFIHKASMAVAAACFVTQLILGPITAVSEGKLYQKDLALAHTVVGWSAFGFMSIGTVAYLIK
jgi:hypothetical protein